MLLTRDYITGLLAHGEELNDWLAVRGLVGGPAEFWAYVQLFEPSPEVWEIHRISHGLERLDLSKVPLGCGCLACLGKAPQDDGCKYLPFSPASRLIASLDAELIAQFWDLPYYLFRLAELRQQASNQRSLADLYCTEKKPTGTVTEQRAEASKAALRGKIRG